MTHNETELIEGDQVSEVLILVIGAALTLAAQFVLKVRDNSEWLKRERMEAHTDLLHHLSIGDQNAHSRHDAVFYSFQKYTPVIFSPENLMRASARVQILSPEDTQEAAQDVAERALYEHGQKHGFLTSGFTEMIVSYVSLAQRDIKIGRLQRVKSGAKSVSQRLSRRERASDLDSSQEPSDEEDSENRAN